MSGNNGFYEGFQLVLFSGKRRYSTKLFKIFTDVFNRLPVAAVIDDKIFCCHGGLSPDLYHIGQIRAIERPVDVPNQGNCIKKYNKTIRLLLLLLLKGTNHSANNNNINCYRKHVPSSFSEIAKLLWLNKTLLY